MIKENPKRLIELKTLKPSLAKIFEPFIIDRVLSWKDAATAISETWKKMSPQ